jgi:hypothetical protein
MFCNGSIVLIAQQWRNWWLYSRIKTYKDLVRDLCQSSTTQKNFEISTATASLYVVTHYTAVVNSSFGYISSGIRIRYEPPTVKVFYDKFINLSAVTLSSYDPLRYEFISVFSLGYLLRSFVCIIIKFQMVGLCMNWTGCGIKQQ